MEEPSRFLAFAAAKFVPDQPVGDVAAPTADTGTGALIGTVRYMSPEQLRGGKVAVGWDLWALAVVAYEALAGAYPFAGTTAAEFSSAILAGQFAPVTSHVPGAPASWQGFFSHALSLDAPARPASAQEVWAEFEKAVWPGQRSGQCNWWYGIPDGRSRGQGNPTFFPWLWNQTKPDSGLVTRDCRFSIGDWRLAIADLSRTKFETRNSQSQTGVLLSNFDFRISSFHFTVSNFYFQSWASDFRLLTSSPFYIKIKYLYIIISAH